MLRLRGVELEQRARVVQALQQRERGRVRGVLTLRLRVRGRRGVRGRVQRGDEVLRVGDRGQRALDVGEQRLRGEKEVARNSEKGRMVEMSRLR